MTLGRFIWPVAFGRSAAYGIWRTDRVFSTTLGTARVAAITTALVLAPASYTQTPALSASVGVHISVDSPKAPFAETFLAINPRDARNLIATSLAGIAGAVHSVAYASRDGGRTWQRAQATTPDNPIFEQLSSDAVVYFDSDGIAFLGTMLLQEMPLRYAVSRSTDGGFTWQPPVILQGGAYDRAYFAFDNTGGRFHGRIYIAGEMSIIDMSGKWRNAIGVAYSTDVGRTFSLGRVITGYGSECAPFDPLLTPEGKLVVPALCWRFRDSGESSTAQLWTMVSEDGGLSFSSAKKGPTYHLAKEPGFRWIRSMTGPRAAVDSSHGPYGGQIYFAYPDFTGQKYVVKVAHSNDLGEAWSLPVAVNDNTNEADISNIAIAVNKDGVVGITFNDRRDDPKNECFRLYFSASIDGGETFLPNLKASEQPTCPFAPGNWAALSYTYFDPQKKERVMSLSSFPMRFANGGETQGLVSGPDGVFHSAWINGESGVMQLWSKDLVVNRATAAQSPRSSGKNLSGVLSLEVNEPRIDFEAHTICARVQLLNPLPYAITGPFAIVLDDNPASSFPDLHVLNSDNRITGRGAKWSFPVAGGKASLQPQQKSEERTLCWGFSGGIPQEPRSLLVPHLLVLGQAQQTSSTFTAISP